MRQELLNVATSTLPWAVQLHSLYDTISSMGGFSESDIVVLANPLNQDLSDYVMHDVGLVVSPLVNAVAPHSYPLDLPKISDSRRSTRSGDSGGHIQRGNSWILRARAYLDLLAFC
jgi:hypothetical protein